MNKKLQTEEIKYALENNGSYVASYVDKENKSEEVIVAGGMPKVMIAIQNIIYRVHVETGVPCSELIGALSDILILMEKEEAKKKTYDA